MIPRLPQALPQKQQLRHNKCPAATATDTAVSAQPVTNGPNCRKSASATDPNATLAAYLVFGKDSLQSELFLPGSRESYLLNRRKTSDGHRWSAASDGTLTVGQADGKWNAERSGKAIYRQQ